MQNPFMMDPKQRLASWKQIREQISQTPVVDDKIDIALAWWKNSPLQNRVMDWDNSQTWPAPWDLIYQNEYCTSAHSLGLAYTLLLADAHTFSDLQLMLIWDKLQCIQKIVVATHGYHLNVGFVDKTHVSQLKTVVIQNTWEWHHKQWISTRPK
jgi:hypothetical protein